MAYTMLTKPKLTRSSGNIFADIGLPNADEHELKARIVIGLARLIASKKLSQTEAARRIGIAQPDLSKVLRGNFAGFSLERLLGALRALGSDIEIKVKANKNADTDREGRFHLVMA